MAPPRNPAGGKAIIDERGGYAVVAKALGIHKNTTCAWRMEDRLPLRWRDAVLALPKSDNQVRRRARFNPNQTPAETRAIAMKQLMDDAKLGAGGCLIFRPERQTGAYGRLWVNNLLFETHRLSWERANGPIPVGMWVLHKCDVPACINPDHLFLGTHQDNSDDKVAKRRQAYGVKIASAKLNEDNVRAIRQSQEPAMRLASMLGVANSTINRIRAGKTWRLLLEGAQ